MILDPNGEAPSRVTRIIEDVSSFGYNLSIKNADGTPKFETAKFFHSQRYECEAQFKDEASREVYAYCEAQVRQDIADFTEKITKKQAAKAAQSVRSIA